MTACFVWAQLTFSSENVKNIYFYDDIRPIWNVYILIGLCDMDKKYNFLSILRF